MDGITTFSRLDGRCSEPFIHRGRCGSIERSSRPNEYNGEHGERGFDVILGGFGGSSVPPSASEILEAKFGGADIDHIFFNHLLPAEKHDIQTRMEKGLSQIVVFRKGKKDVFAAVLDYHEEFIHVREAAGNFPRFYRELSNFAEGVAKFLRKKHVTFCTYRQGIKHRAEKLGYKINPDGDMEKAV